MTRPLNTVSASAYLMDTHGVGRTPGTLRRMRSTGGGPRYLKMRSGEVIYTDEWLDAWAAANLSEHASTASYPPDSGWRRPRRAYNPDGRGKPGDRQPPKAA